VHAFCPFMLFMVPQRPELWGLVLRNHSASVSLPKNLRNLLNLRITPFARTDVLLRYFYCIVFHLHIVCGVRRD
jgi:hypothetical protein